jgi:hypothetical protein
MAPGSTRVRRRNNAANGILYELRVIVITSVIEPVAFNIIMMAADLPDLTAGYPSGLP